MGASGANATIQRVLLTAVVCGAAFLLVLWLAQRSLIYFPDGRVPAPAGVGLPSAALASFTTADGVELEGWFVPAAETSADRTIVVFNGNAGNRAHRAMLAASFAARGFATLLVDYRGYGGNPGLPSEQLTCPLLVIAGTDDRIVPVADTQLLFDAARDPKEMLVIDGAGHNDEELMWGPNVLGTITRFLHAS